MRVAAALLTAAGEAAAAALMAAAFGIVKPTPREADSATVPAAIGEGAVTAPEPAVDADADAALANEEERTGCGL